MIQTITLIILINAFYLKGDLNNDGFLILASSSSPEDYDSSGEIRANDTSSECYYLDDWFYD